MLHPLITNRKEIKINILVCLITQSVCFSMFAMICINAVTDLCALTFSKKDSELK